MFRRLGILCAALALFAIAGGHWAVLQSVAWAGMAVDYSQRSGSVVTGLEQTFNGQYACDLCRAIQTAKSKERKGGDAAFGAKEAAKVKALPVEVPLSGSEQTAEEARMCAVVEDRLIVRTETPPTPPPRRAARVA